MQATSKRIFISVDTEYKNHHSIEGIGIVSIQRKYDNFNRRYTQPVNAIVIDSENIPKGAEILCHHNSTHPTYEIFDYKGLDGNFLSGTVRYFSIPETECYAWRTDGEWNPCYGFDFGLRIFKPYAGALSGLLPTQIKNKLLITSGIYSGKAVMTLGHCDYEIIYQGKNGKESKLIRLRNFPNEPKNIRNEIIAIDHETTDKINEGEYLVGLSPTDCKPSMLQAYAD